MFSSKERKRAKEDLESAVNSQSATADRLKKDMEELYETRQRLKRQIENAMTYINSLRNVPEKLNLTVQKIELEINRYENLLKQATDTEISDFYISNGAVASVGFLTGSGIGGGSLLALTGPVGWVIGGAALVTGGVLANVENKKAASEMRDQTEKVLAINRTQEGLDHEVKNMKNLSEEDILDIKSRTLVANQYPLDFNEMSESEVSMLGALVNNVHSSVERLNARLGENGQFAS